MTLIIKDTTVILQTDVTPNIMLEELCMYVCACQLTWSGGVL